MLVPLLASSLLAMPAPALAGFHALGAWPAVAAPAASGVARLRGAASSLPWTAFWASLSPELAQLYSAASAKVNVSEADPFWTQAAEQIRAVARWDPNGDGAAFSALCSAGQLANYTARGCSADAPGSALLWGIPADAYFCGSNASGIDWGSGSASGRVADLCHAQMGTAYSADGICGSLSTKELVLNVFTTIPLWTPDPLSINVPSIDCLLGLGDCDIFYCQSCSGRCGPK